MPNKGKLFLIPAPIAAETSALVVPVQVLNNLPQIRHFLAEDIRTARRYLSALKVYERIDALSFTVLDKDTKAAEVEGMFRPVMEGHHLGVVSESGCPGVADPGALAVEYAHRHGIEVVPLVGPSSIILALMASGLNGQHFAFHGYLPVQAADAAKAIREFESESRIRNQTQIFIETPYRNNSLFSNLVRNLNPATRLCLAVDVTGEQEFIRTQSVAEWRHKPVTIPKNPAVFLFLA
jgi:16S rRNA (cytidine1402-2'-O)-methyltransferase